MKTLPLLLLICVGLAAFANDHTKNHSPATSHDKKRSRSEKKEVCLPTDSGIENFIAFKKVKELIQAGPEKTEATVKELLSKTDKDTLKTGLQLLLEPRFGLNAAQEQSIVKAAKEIGITAPGQDAHTAAKAEIEKLLSGVAELTSEQTAKLADLVWEVQRESADVARSKLADKIQTLAKFAHENGFLGALPALLVRSKTPYCLFNNADERRHDLLEESVYELQPELKLAAHWLTKLHATEIGSPEFKKLSRELIQKLDENGLSPTEISQLAHKAGFFANKHKLEAFEELLGRGLTIPAEIKWNGMDKVDGIYEQILPLLAKLQTLPLKDVRTATQELLEQAHDLGVDLSSVAGYINKEAFASSNGRQLRGAEDRLRRIQEGIALYHLAEKDTEAPGRLPIEFLSRGPSDEWTREIKKLSAEAEDSKALRILAENGFWKNQQAKNTVLNLAKKPKQKPLSLIGMVARYHRAEGLKHQLHGLWSAVSEKMKQAPPPVENQAAPEKETAEGTFLDFQVPVFTPGMEYLDLPTLPLADGAKLPPNKVVSAKFSYLEGEKQETIDILVLTDAQGNALPENILYFKTDDKPGTIVLGSAIGKGEAEADKLYETQVDKEGNLTFVEASPAK